MSYKLRVGEKGGKPAVRRNLIEIRVPLLLICLVLAFGIWLYVVSFSKLLPLRIHSPDPKPDEETAEPAESSAAAESGNAVLALTPVLWDGVTCL